jgi:subtilisin-like proprotein convertase family protein
MRVNTTHIDGAAWAAASQGQQTFRVERAALKTILGGNMRKQLLALMTFVLCAAVGILMPVSSVHAQVPCVVPDNGSGTVTLPPAGCAYLSPTDVHQIINGLPAGTTVQLTGIHHDFVCGGAAGTPPAACDFVPSPACQQPGGTLGGEEECSDSTLSLTLHGTGTLAGWNRSVQLPVSFETHVGPRVPGAPIQQFPTDMYRLQGQLPPGDPDFDLLRITGGTSNGLPSPGHTTLTKQGTNFAVDSFFDITYRIDFVGHPGGHLGGMSGSTTATIRMATGGTPCGPGGCDDGNPCTTDACDTTTGTCSHVQISCDDGNICTDDFCSPATGGCVHTPSSCDDGNPCTIDSCAQALLAPQCIVPDNGGGTVTLPPAGCDYLSPTDVHQIIDGLPPGTTIQLGAIHRKFICGSQQPAAVCSFPVPIPGVDCDQPGGDLGGEEECAESELALVLHGTGTLTGWNRTIQLPVGFETHVGPRTPGQPTQSFPTEMFQLFGQLPPGDPDFDLLRITAGNNFGLPSPGHTTLRSQGGGNWAVDSFFDITYRIDFVGHPGGHVGGMSGSTTGTIRMQTGQGVGCIHTPVTCDDGNPCTDDACDPVLGCVHTNNDSNTCSDGNACTNDVCVGGACVCPTVTGACSGSVTTLTNNTPVTIPTGPAVVASTITVGPGLGPFLNAVRLTTNIAHTNNADLDITLTSPSGTVVTISSDNGGTNDNVFAGTLWDDKANPGGQVPYASNNGLVTDAITTNNVPLTPVTSEEPLSGAFYGENPNGVWTLRVSDDLAANGGSLNSWGIELTTLPAPPTTATATFTQATPVVLADTPAVETSNLLVSVPGTQIGSVRLTTFIRHTFPGDLDMTLKSPSGTVITISTDNGSGSDNVFNGTVWDDKADPGNQVPFTGDTFAASKLVTDTVYTNLTVKPTLVPEEALAAVRGENPNGTWTLTVSDDATGDTGTLDSWTLEVTTTTCTTTSCAVDCNDNNPCTDDSCDPASGCVHTPNASTCNDGNLCTTGDICTGGTCVGTPVNCDDGNVCTDDACIAATGLCGHTNNTGPCDDGNPCTTGDTCGVSTPTLLSENFDGVTAPALPAGWSTTVVTGPANPWTTTTAFAASAPNSATTDTPTAVSDKVLDSPTFVGTLGTVVDFDHRYNLEFSGVTAFDAAVLEIKIGAGAFTDVVTAGGSFVTGGYTHTVSGGFSSPLANRAAWSGASAGFIHTKVNLPASVNGQSVILRWRVASDSSLSATPPNGQWVDNVVVTSTTATCQPGTPTACDDGNPCTDDSCGAGLLSPACTVADNGGGTVTLPPAGCDYLSPSDVHEIINGLPAGTTIEFGAIHRDFICRGGSSGGGCSFVPPPGTCEQPGGTLGGNEECSDSQLSLTLHGTGALTGWDRPVQVPVKFETHVAPRVPGSPVQSFDTEMFALQGQLPPGDPDFDLLRITAGNSFGLPSPGHTTLRMQDGGTWHVDSFFDITYRIDFVGHPGGHIGGMSGSTTGTIRMATGSGDPCVHTPHNCDDGNPCTVDSCDPASGCVHTPISCDDGQICTVDACDPATGLCTHTGLSCDDGNACTADTCIQALAPACIVPDNGAGTVTLPPAGCDYLSPQDVHQIVSGLPAGTTIELGAIHKDFICTAHPGAVSICSFVPPAGFCDQPGGTMGGREECSSSNLALTLHGTGVLAGYNRSMQIPVEFETHVGPRTPGAPMQSFATDMFRLQGQLPAGDPDFDLLRITAGTDFGLPSPGHTTLTQQGGGNWAVDSFFDITYRIDFVGHSPGPLSGMSGSTTATIRMQTGSGVGCVHTAITCNDSNECTNDGCDPASGCFFVNNTNACSDGNPCTAGDICGGGVCAGTPITAPPETQGVLVASDKATFNWAAAPFAVQYDVVRGDLALLPVGPGGGDEVCFDDLPVPTLNDPTNPTPGKGQWYLSRGENSCGIGTFGTTHTGTPRITTTCP